MISIAKLLDIQDGLRNAKSIDQLSTFWWANKSTLIEIKKDDLVSYDILNELKNDTKQRLSSKMTYGYK